MRITPLGKNIWIYEGSTVNFYGFDFPTRMTVIKLNDNSLWIHSPEKLNNELKNELEKLGEIKHIISPNKLHHLFLPEWIEAYPKAIQYAAPGLAKKRKDIKFDIELSDNSKNDWEIEIDQIVFQGSPAMEEVVFYHKSSKTLILTDLIENFDPNTLNWWQRGIAKLTGILAPNGKTPIDWRISFAFGSKHKARLALNIIMNWDTENIVLSHGK